nr:spidroin-1-like [Marmota flaviventris]
MDGFREKQRAANEGKPAAKQDPGALGHDPGVGAEAAAGGGACWKGDVRPPRTGAGKAGLGQRSGGPARGTGRGWVCGGGRRGARAGGGAAARGGLWRQSVTHAAAREAAAAAAAGAAGTGTGARARAGAGCLPPSLASSLSSFFAGGRAGLSAAPSERKKGGRGRQVPAAATDPCRGGGLWLRRGRSTLRGGAHIQSVRIRGRPGLLLAVVAGRDLMRRACERREIRSLGEERRRRRAVLQLPESESSLQEAAAAART